MVPTPDSCSQGQAWPGGGVPEWRPFPGSCTSSVDLTMGDRGPTVLLPLAVLTALQAARLHRICLALCPAHCFLYDTDLPPGMILFSGRG